MLNFNKRKKLLLISVVWLGALAFSTFLTVTAPAQVVLAANLLQNPGFEAITGSNLPSNWSAQNFDGGIAEHASDSAVFHSGTRSARIHADVPRRASFSQQITGVSGGQYYDFSAWLKTDTVETSERGTAIRFQFSNAVTTTTGPYLLVNGPKGVKDWTQIRQIVLTPPNTTKLQVEIFLWNTAGTLWADDVSLELTTKLPSPMRFTANSFPGQNSRLSWLPGYTPAMSLTVSVYNHSQPLTEANLSAATLVKSGIPLEAEFFEHPFDLTNRPYVGIVLRDASGRASSVTAAKIEPLPVLKTLKLEHPRLFASAADFTALRNRIPTDSFLQTWNNKIKQNAQQIISSPVSTYTYGPEGTLLKVSRQVLSRISTLGMAYQMENKPEYVERAWQELEAAANFPDWHPAHFLDTAQMTHAFALGYDWLYHAWTPQRREVIRNAILTRGMNISLASYRNIYLGNGSDPLYWEFTNPHNWNGVCNGGIGMGALAIADEYPYLTDEILQYGRQYIKNNLLSYEPDGSYSEGVDYWEFATTYIVGFIASLESAVGTDFGLSYVGGLAQTGYFPIYLNGAEDKFYYGDAWPGFVRSAELFWLAKKFNQPLFSGYQRPLATGEPLDLLWYNPAIYQAPTNLPTDRIFPDVQIATFRNSWSDPKSLFVGFKGRVTQEGHNHLDGGTFVLDALGERWAEELSADDYALPGYFDSTKRWEYYRMRAEGQNTLVLNPGSGPDQATSVNSKLVASSTKPEGSFAVLDLTAAYPATTTGQVWRGLATINNRSQVLLQDEISTNTPSEAWWFMHTKTSVAISIAPGGKEATLISGTNRVWVKMLSPTSAGIVFTETTATPLPTSPHPAGQNANTNYHKLAIKLDGLTNTRLAILFVPLASGENPPAQLPTVVELAKWNEPQPVTLQAHPQSASAIKLNWANPGNATGFRIERRAEGSSSWTQINQAGATATTYTDNGLTASTRYYYRIQPFNVASAAAYSPEVNARTFSSGTLIVTNPQDRGATLDAATVGTLSYALTQAASGSAKTILFDLTDGGQVIQVSGNLPTVPAGVTIYAGECGTPPLTLNGSSAPNGTTGLQLTTGSGIFISNLKISGFKGPQLKVPGGYQQLSCVAALR